MVELRDATQADANAIATVACSPGAPPIAVCSPTVRSRPRELEIILATALNARPELRITVIIDGLDHADRLSHPGRRLALDIAQELDELDLPDGVRLVVGSQAGDHLAPLLSTADTCDVQPWADEHIRALAVQAGVGEGGALSQHAVDVTEVQDAIIDKAQGNPLYATYLSRTALGVAGGDIKPGNGYRRRTVSSPRTRVR